MSDPDWSCLPSVVLFDLYHILPLHDRLAASSTCKKWRDSFYLYPNWRKLQVDTILYKEEKNSFLLSKAKKHCKSLSVAYVAKYFSKVVNMLYNWPGNHRLQEIHLLGSGEPLAKSFPLQFNNAVYPILDNCSHLVSLFLSHFDDIERLNKLIIKHSSTLIHLGVGKLSLSTDKKSLRNVKTLNISSLHNLLILHLDGEHITENILENCIVHLKKLKRLIFNVRENNPVGLISAETWDSLSTNLPRCEIHVNYYRITDTVCIVHNPCLLTKCQNITRLRMIYCSPEFQEMCMNALMKQPSHLHTIQSIWAIFTGLNDNLIIRHPFVVCAWRFKHLRELLISGALFDKYDVIGMLRVRKKLHISIAKEDIAAFGAFDELKNDIKETSENPEWEPMANERFNDLSLTPGDREATVLREILKEDLKILNNITLY